MDMRIVRNIHRLFKEKGLTLSAAESCTGGLISHVLTALPGASRFFHAGVVTYSAASKKKILGIPAKVLDRYGVVSEETARQMAERVRFLTRTDVSVATTGNLGPDALEEKPTGMVYVSVSTGKGTVVKKLMLRGGRAKVREEAVLAALSLVAEVVIHG